MIRRTLLYGCLLWLLAACTPTGVTVTRAPTTPTPSGETLPAYALPARDNLAKTLGLTPAQVVVKSIEEMTWPNACLGHVRTDDVCLEVITPGYRIIFGTPQGDYVYHSNQTGEKFRAVGPVVGETPTPTPTVTPVPIKPGASGIEGQVFISPTCGGPVRPGQNCTAPYQAVITVLDTANNVVTQVTSDANGRFSLALPPGVYTLRPEKPNPGPARAAEVSVTVESGRLASVEIMYDSGLR